MITLLEIPPGDDPRGTILMLDAEIEAFLGAVKSAHAGTVLPGALRGDHYHLARKEILLAMPGAAWTLYWDDGEGQPRQTRRFDGGGMVLVRIPPGSAHAIASDGEGTLSFISFQDGGWTPDNPDTFRRKVSA